MLRGETRRDNTAKPAAALYRPRRFSWQLCLLTLRAERRARRLSLRSLAERLGVAHSTVRLWESGRGNMPVERFVAWCNELQVAPEECFKARDA